MARISRTGTTDSTGVASTTVSGSGGGRLKFISRNGGLWSNSKEVLDCIVVDKGTSSEHNDIWATNSYMELNRFETYTKLQTKSTASSFGLSQYSISQTPICIEWETQLISKSSGWIFTIRNSGTIRYGVTGANCGVSDEEWHNVKFVIDGTGFKYYLDGELTLSNTTVYSFNTFQMDTRDGMSINFKNFKVYPVFTAPKHYTPIALSSSASIIQTGETATLTAELTNVLGEKLAQKSVNFIEKFEHSDPLTSESGKWTIPSTATATYSNDGMTLTGSAWSDLYFNTEITTPCTIEFDLINYSASATNVTYFAFYLWNTSKSTRLVEFASFNNGTVILHEYNGASNQITYTPPVNSHIRLEIDTNKITAYFNDIEKISLNYTMPSSFILGLATGTNRSLTWKNFEVNSESLIGTGTTNSQGIATCNITGTGKGERQFIASNSSILSETYTIIDNTN